MLSKWKAGFARFYRNLPALNRQRFRRHMFIQLILSFLMVWMSMRSAKDMRGWMLFFVVWTAVDMIILQWMYETDKEDKVAGKIASQATNGQSVGQPAQPGNGQASDQS